MSIDRILSSIPGKTPAERAKMRANAERLLSTGTAAQKADAGRLLEALDTTTLAERAGLNDLVSKMPMSERVAEAFRKHPPTPTEETIIRALLDNPNASSVNLSRACGWDGLSWHLHFGAMARKREADLWPAEVHGKNDTSFFGSILADSAPDGSWFVMKPEAVLGFAAIGITARHRNTEGV